VPVFLWYKLCFRRRGQRACFVCVINYVLERGVRVLFCVLYHVCRSDVSECLFCMCYKTFGGVRFHSACFVCGINYVLE
jgi:hypothetical protein